jgi:hypothetical protein
VTTQTKFKVVAIRRSAVVTKQDQRAGENSRQLQAGRDIIVAGVSAADVVEITQKEVARVLDELTLSARGKADTRIKALADRVITEFKDRPEVFGAFSDPDFQYSLRDAGRAAASNDDEHTERLLVDLLANRAKEGNSSRVRLATSQAIRAADKLSLEALNGLTALWAVGSLSPLTDLFANQLMSLSNTARVLVELGLPSDGGWVRDADVLNLVRVHYGALMSRTPHKAILEKKMAVNLVTGIDMETSSALVAAATSAVPELGEHLLPHPLKPGFVRLGGHDKSELLTKLPSSAAESAELQQLIEQNSYGSTDPAAAAKLDETVAGIASLTALTKWWDSTPPVDFTVVGDVVAFVNARRHLSFQGAGTVSELLQLRT